MKNVFLLDGGFGTEIQKYPWYKEFRFPEEILMTEKGMLATQKIHEAYIKSGSDFITTNSFGLNLESLSKYFPEDTEKHLSFFCDQAIKAARRAVENTGGKAKVRFSLGPCDSLPSLSKEIYSEKTYTDVIKLFEIPLRAALNADVLCLETQQDPILTFILMKRFKEICKENRKNIPIHASFTTDLQNNIPVTLSGHSLQYLTDFSTSLTQKDSPFYHKDNALGVNCTTQIDQIGKLYQIPNLIFKPNAGVPKIGEHNHVHYDLHGDAFTEQFKEVLDTRDPNQVLYLGGCCGSCPDDIKALAKYVETRPYTKQKSLYSSIIPYSTNLSVNQFPVYVGERLNRFGSKRFREAINSNDRETVEEITAEQVANGAHILDLCVSGDISKIEREEFIKWVPIVFSSGLPISMDSKDVKAVQQTLQYYPGRHVFNSVSMKDVSDGTVKKMLEQVDCNFVVSLSDEEGVPTTLKEKAEKVKRFQQVREKALKEQGISPQRFYIDPCCLPLFSGKEQDFQNMQILDQLFHQYQEPYFLGVSNLTFGLPIVAREKSHKEFMKRTSQGTRNFYVCDPKAFKQDTTQDQKQIDYLFLAQNPEAFLEWAQSQKKNKDTVDNTTYLGSLIAGFPRKAREIIEKSMQEQGRDYTINQILIPALEELGTKFDKGAILLPQLIKISDVIQQDLDKFKTESSGASGSVVMATVKNDRHTIGRDLVSLFLSNAGYKVYTIGVDQSFEQIYSAIQKYHPDYLGLSGLLFQSLFEMQEVLRQIKAKGYTKPIILGGNVVTEDFIEKHARPLYENIYRGVNAIQTVNLLNRINPRIKQ